MFGLVGLVVVGFGGFVVLTGLLSPIDGLILVGFDSFTESEGFFFGLLTSVSILILGAGGLVFGIVGISTGCC